MGKLKFKSLQSPYKGGKWAKVQTVRATSMEPLEIVVGKKRGLVVSMVERGAILRFKKRRGKCRRGVKNKILNWWRLGSNLARHNEYLMLELLGAWEPTKSSKARGFDPGTRSFSLIFS